MNVRYLPWNKPREPTEKEVSITLKQAGMQPYTYVMERGENVGVHHHRYTETRILLEGEVEFCAEGRTFILKPGDRIDILKQTPHTAKNLANGQSVMLCGSG